jgi:quinone-modifying oxidoreductase, subunit QmoA
MPADLRPGDQFPRIKDNPRIKVLTMAEVEKVEGAAGNYKVAVRFNPRYINENCTCCGDCAKACATDQRRFQFRHGYPQGAYLPFEMAFPARYVISPQIIGTDDAQKAKEACKYDAVDLEMQPKTMTCKSARRVGHRLGTLRRRAKSTIWASANTATSSPT